MLAPVLLAAMALAGTNDSESCVRGRIWDSYSEGWAVRTVTSTDLADSSTRSYAVTLHAGNQYRIAACDVDVRDLDVLVYDAAGTLVAEDATADGRPLVEITPPETGEFVVVLHVAAADERDSSAALAVIFRDASPRVASGSRRTSREASN